MSEIKTIKELIAAVLAKLEELAEGETWLQIDESGESPVRSQVPLATYIYRLPKENRSEKKPIPYPHVIGYKMSHGRGDDGFGRVVIRLDGGIYNDDEENGGEDDIERLEALVLLLAKEQDFYNWSLDEDIVCKPIEEDGSQHHPKYYFTADLSFVRQA